MDIVKKILQFNKQNQQGQGEKILTTDKILSRLQITLAQLKAGNNSKRNLKMRQDNYCILCIVQKN